MPRNIATLLCLAAMIFAMAESKSEYTQKINCMPGLDDCAKDYGEYDPPSNDYLQKRVGPGVGLGIVCILICCLVWWCWCCCRCCPKKCCECCPFSKCCCGVGEEDGKWTGKHRCCLVITLIVAAALLVCGFGLGYSGGVKTFDGGVDLMDQALAAVTEMESLNTNVAKVAFTQLSGFFSGSGGAVTYNDAEINKAIGDVKKIINDAKDSMTSIDDSFKLGVTIFYAACIASTLLGFIAWICSKGCCAMIMAWVGAIFLFISWLLFAVFYMTGVFLDDTCTNLSTHYHLDCMLEPGKTCQRAKLTDFFQCPKISTVSTPYQQAWNLIDTAPSNGAGANTYGTNAYLMNKRYGDAVKGSGISILAPAAINQGTAKCGTAACSAGAVGTAAATEVMGMEPYTTCDTGYSFNNADASLTGLTTPIEGNRRDSCTNGNGNAGAVGPKNANLVAKAVSNGITSVNPPWAGSAQPTGTGTGYSIGTCERACLNASATSGGVLDSLTNFGGNCMFRKFVYETFTTVYTSGSQGYAACGSSGANSKIAWQTTSALTATQAGLYQNYSAWMTAYAAGGKVVNGAVTDTCVANDASAQGCQLCDGTTTRAECTTSGSAAYPANSIPFRSPANGGTTGSNTNPAGCFQAATMAVSDIMYALSYIGSCNYIKTFALLTAVDKSGACFDLGDGLVYLMCAQGLMGVGFFMVTIVGVMGSRRFDSSHFQGDDDHEDEDPEDKFTSVGLQDTSGEIQPYDPAGRAAPGAPA